MTQSNNRLFDEFARLATDAAAVAQGVRREAETTLRSQAERFASELNLVHRDEFEAAKELAVRACAESEALRTEIAQLQARVTALEAKHATGEGSGGAASSSPSVGGAE